MHAAEETLALRLRVAVVAGFGAEYDAGEPQLRAATRPEFGHFETNLPLRLAKPTGLPPLEVGERLLAGLHVADVCLPPTLAGQGFINVTLRRSSWLPR